MSIASPTSQTPTDPAQVLRGRIESRAAVAGVIGLGYVGLPLAWALHERGFRILGYDVDHSKIRKLHEGEAYIHHLDPALPETFARSDRFDATADPARLAEPDVILLCVPTPLGPHDEPDLRFVTETTAIVARSLRAGQLVILESTTYPGTTRDVMQPKLEATGLECGEDFFLAYSPEREDPGRTKLTTSSIPKIVGGVDAISGDLAEAFYGQFIDTVHRVSSAEAAEAAKLLENIYRAVNIALVNELKMLMMEMGIDVWEVIDAAATKPFGFQRFDPGPGMGGHCIPIDPFYLAWKAREHGVRTKFIELAGEVNRRMPGHVVEQVTLALNDDARPVRGSRVLVLGIAYKPNIDDIRESPAAPIIERLRDLGAEVSYHDPHMPAFPSMRKHRIDLASVELTPEILEAADAVVVVTHHDAIDWSLVGRHARLVVDTRNAMSRADEIRGRLVKA